MSASVQKSDVTVVSTASWEVVAEFGTGYGFNHILVRNYTDGDVEIAFGDTTYPDMVIKEDSDVVLDDFYGKSPVYVRNSSGTGGNVYIKVWSNINIP